MSYIPLDGSACERIVTMAEEKTLHLYHGKEIDVTWDAKRCHMRPSACADSARCLTGGADQKAGAS